MTDDELLKYAAEACHLRSLEPHIPANCDGCKKVIDQINADPENYIIHGGSAPGYNHTQIQGLCGPKITVDMIRERYYHSMFGGRSASVRDGRFSVIRHDD